MLLVTGATGQLGGSVLRQLLRRVEPTEIAAFARDASKAAELAAAGVSVRLGDYDDVAALDAAMSGVSRVVLVAGNNPQLRMQQHQNVIDAAVRAGVDQFAFAGRALRDVASSTNRLMGDYLDTEERIKRSGLPFLFFRNALYLDTLPAYVGGRAGLAGGQLRLPTGAGTVAYALRREMGEGIANALLDHPAESDALVLAAPEAYSMDDIANTLTEISGSPIRYVPVPEDEYLADALASGMPESRARSILGFYSDIRAGQLSETSTDLTELLGRKPASLSAGLREVFGF